MNSWPLLISKLKRENVIPHACTGLYRKLAVGRRLAWLRDSKVDDCSLDLKVDLTTRLLGIRLDKHFLAANA
ncbi:hypothetical protein RIF29_42152 [Crotalaria pallida]|uniref:Uncharacterized protein n=1 Tax=Crotalaria pallida TaxID=3830 RepID=A0AAN9E8M0_CROPI